MKETCPTRDILVQFVSATLTDTEADKIVAHLDSCESCCRTVDELERTQPAMAALDRLRDIDDLNKIESPLPKKIGQYEIVEQIGQGGMGVVYRAVHPHLKREVALKVIRDSRLDDPSTRERFVQEMQSLGKLSHPNIVLATDAGIDGETPFIVTELLDGHDLGTWIAAHGKMPVKQAVDCIRQAATGLAYAHKAGYVHRDIKPSNLFLTHDGVIKILDLGIARPPETSPNSGQTVTGHIVGSPEFMAPEQFHDGTVDARSDIYSLGRTFAYLLNGNVPTKLKRILAKMTAGLPDQRFQTADELIRALAAATKSHKLLFCTVLAMTIILATICLMQSLSVPDADPADSSSFVETKIEPESTPEEHDSFIRRFDITSPTGWDGFFEDVMNHRRITQPVVSTANDFTFFRFLRRMGRDADADRLVSRLLSELQDDPFPEQKRYIKEYHIAVDWEEAAGNKEKADKYRTRIRELIADEKSGLEREQFLQDYETRKKFASLKEERFIAPRALKDAIIQAGPSVKGLCDRGQYREAVARYKAVLRSSDDYLIARSSKIYDGYGLSYVISRMVEKGEVDEARKLSLDTPHSTSMDFRIANSLALGYLKSGRKAEAQTAWDSALVRLTKEMLNQTSITDTMYLSTLLESVNDTGLYDYVRNEFGK